MERTNNYFLLKEYGTYRPWNLWFGVIHFYHYTSNLKIVCVCLWLLMARMEVVLISTGNNWANVFKFKSHVVEDLQKTDQA